MANDPWQAFDPEAAQLLKDVFDQEFGARFQPVINDNEDRALRADEDRMRAKYPDYDANRLAILNFAIANGGNLEDGYHDHAFARDEAQMRAQYGEDYDYNRDAILEHAIKTNEANLEAAVTSFRQELWTSGDSGTSARGQAREDRLETLRLRPDLASQIEVESLKRERLEDKERALTRNMRDANRAEAQRESIRNSNNEKAILNERRTDRARAGKIDTEPPKHLDREALDREAISLVTAANDADPSVRGSE